MRTSTCAVVGWLMVSCVAVGQQKSGDEAALMAIEAKWDAASLGNDTAALAGIYSDRFISINTDGKVRTKAEVLGPMKSGDVKYQVAKADEMKVYLYGDTAIVSGRWTGKFIEKGKHVDATERFTDTFVRQNGQWKCVASHASSIK